MKNYKKILEGVVNIVNTAEKSDIGFANICAYIGENCPELAESEDERIKKEIIAYFKSDWAKEEGITRPDWIAWLEKQGEQKLVDKVEPKFKINDWVVFKNHHQSIYQVEKIENGYYILRHTHGGTFRVCILHDEDLRPWTIQDAKDGDVLCSEQIILLFKQWEDNTDYNFVIAYAGIDISGKLQITNDHWLISNKSKPATKKQRDILIKAIVDDGYTFDFNKKELRKIEQKPTDEEMKETLRTEYEKGRADAIAEMQKLGWSEKDEKMISDIATYLNRYGNYILNKNEEKAAEIHKAADWIKSLKDKVYI